MKFKKLSVALLLMGFGLTSFAQNETQGIDSEKNQSDDSSLKASAGSNNLELQFIPFGGAPIGINGIRYRNFLTSKTAFRFTGSLSFNNTNTPITLTDGGGDEIEENNTNSFLAFSFAPGYEWHYAGTKRLSPYVGAELVAAFRRNSEKEYSIDIANDDEVYYTQTINTNGNDFFRLSINGLAGFDYYVAKNLYLGAELGYGLSLTNNLQTKVKSDKEGFEEPDGIKNGSSFGFSPFANGAIRLGFIF